jgi:hypothetical protein
MHGSCGDVYLFMGLLRPKGSIAGTYHEVLLVLGVRSGGFFANFRDAGKSRPTLKLAAKLIKLFGGSDREDFHAAVLKITHVPSKLKSGGSALRKVTKPNTLDEARDDILSGLFLFVHQEAKL